MVFRVYVERRLGFDAEAAALCRDPSRKISRFPGCAGVRCLNRYDVEGVSREVFGAAGTTVFSEPQTDMLEDGFKAEEDDFVLAVEYLPGQFDQRADSCAQCIQLLARGERPRVRTARIYIFSGDISSAERDKIRSYIVNPVESREASPELPATLDLPYDAPEDIAVLDGFRSADPGSVIREYGLAMDAADVRFCQSYFEGERRDPTMTELRMIDTYWSDHCRHTTFLTELGEVEAEDGYVQATLLDYLDRRAELYRDSPDPKSRPVTLMDLATVAAKILKRRGAAGRSRRVRRDQRLLDKDKSGYRRRRT